jgi:DNA-binding beta-propeller fold protein YncE
MRVLAPAAVAVAAGMLAGCGSAPVEELPPAAGPARSPALTQAPAGRVVRVGRRPQAVALARGGRIAVVLDDRRRLALVDGRSGRVVRRRPLRRSARHLETVAAGGRVFVADRRDDGLRVTDGRGVERSFPAPAEPTGVAATADGSLVVVVGGRERILVLYDGRTGRRLGSAPAGVGPTHVAVHGHDAYVTDTRGGSFLVYSLRPELDLVRRVSLRGGPYGIAVDPVRSRLWVTLTAKNELAELPATRLPRIVRHFPTVRQPDGVAVDPRTGRVFVTGREAGVLQLVDP